MRKPNVEESLNMDMPTWVNLGLGRSFNHSSAANKLTIIELKRCYIIATVIHCEMNYWVAQIKKKSLTFTKIHMFNLYGYVDILFYSLYSAHKYMGSGVYLDDCFI